MPRKRPKPLAPPPMMKSRKKARQVTTLFHKHTRDQELAMQNGDLKKVKECEEKIKEIGGRTNYQRASQLSTSFHSTSRWVLGNLAQRGWLYGIVTNNNNDNNDDNHDDDDDNNNDNKKNIDNKEETDKVEIKKRRNKKKDRRPMRLLEVGAINTELLDASIEPKNDTTITTTSGGCDNNNNNKDDNKRYKLHVRSIDLHSMDDRIEEADFLQLPIVSSDLSERYDAIVCSMVLNCVPTAHDRGRMLARLFHQLRPGGLCFLTIPKLCLTQSAFLTTKLFQDLLLDTGVGFEIEQTKESPKISFFILRRPRLVKRSTPLHNKWTKRKVINKGKKFPNQFSIVLNENEIFGRNFSS